MAFNWTPDLATGNSMIDSQHKQLFDALNGLLDACAQGQGRAEAGRAMAFLKDYTVKHFGDEEALQKKCGYPEYITHKGYHEGFKKVVAELEAELSKTGPTTLLVGKINRSVGEWLVSHIKREDKKLAAYIRSRG